MTVYARYDGERRVNYITPGKLYPVRDENETAFVWDDDDGEEQFSRWNDSSHLDGANWTRVELPDEDEPNEPLREAALDYQGRMKAHAQAQVYTTVYSYERDHGQPPSQAARTAGYAVSVFKREAT